MKLTPDSITSFENLVNAAITAGLSKLIIGDGQIRGIDEKQTVVIVTDQKVPDFGGKKVAITNFSGAAQRVALIHKAGGLEVEAVVAKNDADIAYLELYYGKTKVQYRCAAPDFVKGVPKGINDQLAWAVEIPPKTATMLADAARVMGSEKITVASKDGKTVTFELVEKGTNEVFSTELETPPTWLIQGEAAPTGFCLNYLVKSLMPLLIKDASAQNIVITIGKQGILSLRAFGLDFYVVSVT